MARYRHRRHQQPTPFAANVLAASFMFGLVVYIAAPQLQPVLTGSTAMLDKQRATEQSVYYPNCRAARAAGAAPMNRGSPGYRPEMDGDGDGIACEPYYGD